MATIFGIDIEDLRKATAKVARELLVKKYGEQVKTAVNESVSRGWNAAQIRVAEDDAYTMIAALDADGFHVKWNRDVPDLIAFGW